MCLSTWTTTGKQKVIAQGTEARTAEDAIVLASIFQEIIQSVFDGRVSAVDGGTCIKAILGEQPDDQDAAVAKFDARSIFLDTLSILTDSDTSHPALRTLVFSTDVSPALMRQELETPLLQSLGLIRDTFARMGIRKQTNILYRQSNYNLLREESEGYSKLLTELFTTPNSEPPSSEVVQDTFERVKGMIGAFDMDVGRVLDVTLDVFAAVLVKQYRFCVKFLRASSWWPKEDDLIGHLAESGLPKWARPGSAHWVTTEEEREDALRDNAERDRLLWDRVREVGIRAFFEIGRRPASDAEIAAHADNPMNEDGTYNWIKQTGTLPPKGNRVAAQLLGFKLRFYSSQIRNTSDVLPDNLIYLAALLIKVGFISLRDLYPHLWRPDDSMEALKEEKMKEKIEREKAARPGGGSMNALLAAGTLSDDTLPPPPRIREPITRTSTPAKDQEQEKPVSQPDEKEQLPEPAIRKCSC
jgi:THO complex subunit 2